MKRQTITLWLASKDPRTPWYAKALILVVVAYALSPIDLIPDFIPVLGMLDDLIIVPLGLALAVRLIPAEVMAESAVMAQEMSKSDYPTNWFMVAAIVVIWIASAAFLLHVGFQGYELYFTSKDHVQLP